MILITDLHTFPNEDTSLSAARGIRCHNERDRPNLPSPLSGQPGLCEPHAAQAGAQVEQLVAADRLRAVEALAQEHAHV